MLSVSILEGLYIIFMFNLFKTCKYIHHPFEQLFTNHPFLKHPISDSKYNNKICYFGKFSSYLLIIWLIIRFKIKRRSGDGPGLALLAFLAYYSSISSNFSSSDVCNSAVFYCIYRAS